MDAFDNSDSESFSETSSEDLDDVFSIYSGQAKSILSNLEDSIAKLDDFLSFERAYNHGDIVCSVGDPSGQMGTVVNVNMFVDLENGFGKAVHGIDSREIVRIRSIVVGDYVINGPWIGRVDKVVDCVGIIFDDGTKHKIMATDSLKLMPVSANLLDESLYPCHPGQRVKLILSSASKSSGGLCGMLKKSNQEGVIYSVEAGSVYVDWLASALTCASTTIPPPPHIQDPKDLIVLPCFPHTNWILGEWCILSVAEKNIETDTTFRGNLLKEHKKLLSGMNILNRRDFNSNIEDMYEIVKQKMKFDVVWQDGSQSMGLESRALIPVTAVNASDFFPETPVLEKSSCDELNVSKDERWGVVKFVDAKERTVKVEWKTMPGNTNALDGKLLEEMVSAYELVEHPDFAFGFGDIVFLLGKNHFVGHTDFSTMREADISRSRNGQDGSGENQIECFLSNTGSVTGFKDGDVQVQWASGMTTKVAPYAIVRIDKDDGSLATFLLHEESIPESNGELTEQQKQSLQNEEKDSFNVNNASEGSSTSFGFRQAAIGFFTSIATNFFGSHGSTSQGQPLADADISEGSEIRVVHEPEVLTSSSICTVVVPMVINDSPDNGDETVEQKLERTPGFSCNQNLEHFKQFDVVSDCSDHHFINGDGKGSSMSQVKSGWLKKVQQEWSILEKDLPETIFVHIYEERMDLIRAAIIGAPGTPYHDGLFFFDIFLPPDYPDEPPSVHYHSGGLCLNPNLYESGKVCLSLLNTWKGTGSELWNCGTSTILQVLLSLQALVLNEKPYFNEAGYDKQIGCLEGEKNSVSYNENAFLVTCKSMLYLLRKPPKHFEGLVQEHFQRRSKHILAACKAYMKGSPVGSFGHEKTGAAHEKENSTGFKIMLAKLFPKLVEAFSAIGADCSEFTEP